MKVTVEKTELYTRVESEDGAVTGIVFWTNGLWKPVYIDNRSGEINEATTQDKDHWEAVSKAVMYVLKTWYGVPK